jgi:hypothetical protein
LLTKDYSISLQKARHVTSPTTESFQIDRFIKEAPGHDLKVLSMIEYALYVAAARGEHQRSLLRQMAIIDGLFP